MININTKFLNEKLRMHIIFPYYISKLYVDDIVSRMKYFLRTLQIFKIFF